MYLHYLYDLIIVFILFCCIHPILLVYCACQIHGSDPLSWCLGIDLDPVPDGDVLLEAPLAYEYGWGPVDPEVKLEDGVHLLGA